MMGDVHHVMGVPNHLSICDVKLHACMACVYYTCPIHDVSLYGHGCKYMIVHICVPKLIYPHGLTAAVTTHDQV